jgi:hypothetical protein
MANKWRSMLKTWDRDLPGLTTEQLESRAQFARTRENNALAKGLGRNPKAAREWRAKRRAVEDEIERRVTRG